MKHQEPLVEVRAQKHRDNNTMLPQRRRPEAASIGQQDYKRLGSGARRRYLEPDAADDEGTDDEEERWRQHAMLLVDEEHDHYSDHNYQDDLNLPNNLRRNEQDDSSLSIAQSGCQSILSAWRQRVSRASQRNQQRPVSVLSNGTSVCSKKTTNSSCQGRRRGKSPASQTRIPLGPRHAQHFVTNTRRRRHADELVLNALEARRRAFQIQRQQSSLFDDHSPDYQQQHPGSRTPLSGAGGQMLVNSDSSLIKRRSNSPGLYAGSRLSLSPSPLRSSPAPRQQLASDRCPPQASPASPRAGHSHRLSSQLLSAGVGSAAGGKNNSTSLPASSAQRQRLLRALNDQQQVKKRTPPLAKLDQNSSDLCSQNSSRASSTGTDNDEDDDRSSYSSSGSQFTQLVTAELAPNCAFLELQDQVRRPDASDSWPKQVKTRQRTPRMADTVSPREPQLVETPVQKRHQQQLTPVMVKGVESEELDETEGGKLRRGALKRDSIRRLRLNRQHQSAAANYSTSSVSSELTPSSTAPSQPHQPLSQAISSTPCQPAARNLLKNHPPKPSPATTSTTARGALQRVRPSPEIGLTGRLVGHENEPPTSGSNKIGKQELKPAAPARPTSVRYHRPTMEQRPPVLAPAASFVETPNSSETNAKYLSSTALNLVSQMSTNEQRLAAMRAAGAQKGREAAINHLMALKESSKSRDDLRYDATGNLLHHQMSESLREERSLNQFKSISRRIEITRSETNNISPPPAFADPSSRQITTNRHNENQPSPSNITNKYSAQSTNKIPPDQPVAPTRRRLTGMTQNTPPPPVIQPKPKQLQVGSIRKPEESLPRFESSADEEFKKRIEKLRMTARANTAVSSMAGQGPTGKQTNGATAKSIATRPLSISNWRPQPETTNLDALMLASNLIERRNRDSSNQDQRQTPENLRGAWRRSNSSLARTSLPSSCGEEQLQQPPKIPSPAPVKLMVKERSTPKPDFAFVAPRASSMPKTSQPATHQQQNKYQIQEAATNGSGKFDAPTNQPPISRLRSASPKSPDIGGQPSSSNEDSAIASSVSSPSLSFMMNASQQQRQQQLPAIFKSPQPSSQFRPPPPAPPHHQKQPQQMQEQLPAQLSIRKAPESGALQSILRRQQQQFGALDKEIANLDNDSIPIKTQVTTYQQDRPQSPLICGRPEVRSAEPQQQAPHPQAAATGSSPAKRVHFNDLASVRSFESISSHTSNSTAVPNEMLRQQVGSPDSMASSSGQSRLSNDSPDLRSGCRDGAAIYAIRGDPELELDAPQMQAPLMLPLHPAMHHQPTPIQHPHQQLLRPKPTSAMGYTLQRSPLGYPSNPLGTSELHQQQPVPAASIHPTIPSFINMTAPPASSLRPTQQVCDAVGLASRRLLPPGPIQMAIPVPQPYLHQVVQQQSPGGMQVRRHPPEGHPHDADDDDDPNYALRLRQASTRGAAYPGFPLQQQQQQVPLKPPPPVPRRMSSELCNFQTEV